MSSNVYDALFARIPRSTNAGKVKVIKNTLNAAIELKEAVRVASTRDDLTAKGRVPIVKEAVKVAAAVLAKAGRQIAYHARKLSEQRAAVHKKAIGERQPADKEHRDYLRSLPLGERVQRVLTDPAARGAALREPSLSGLKADVLDHALAIALRENTPKESAALAEAEAAQAVHEMAKSVLQREILGTPFVIEPDGAIRPLHSPMELESFVANEVPAPHFNRLPREEAEADEGVPAPRVPDMMDRYLARLNGEAA